jgi:predicted small secreted protein
MKICSFSPALRIMILLSAGLVVQGCNTTEGLGKDMSVAGQAVTDAAQENSTY